MEMHELSKTDFELIEKGLNALPRPGACRENQGPTRHVHRCVHRMAENRRQGCLKISVHDRHGEGETSGPLVAIASSTYRQPCRTEVPGIRSFQIDIVSSISKYLRHLQLDRDAKEHFARCMLDYFPR
jgi:hypothetical protein